MNTHEHTNTYTNTLHKHTHTYARTKRSSLSRFHAHTPPTHVYCDCCRIELVTPVTHELKEQWEVEDMRELSPLPPPSPFHPLFFCKLNTNCHYSCSCTHGRVPAAASPAVDLMFCFVQCAPPPRCAGLQRRRSWRSRSAHGVTPSSTSGGRCDPLLWPWMQHRSKARHEEVPHHSRVPASLPRSHVHGIFLTSLLLSAVPCSSQVAGHKDANLFRHPVKPEHAPGYYDLIKQPMDLGTIEQKIKNKVGSRAHVPFTSSH